MNERGVMLLHLFNDLGSNRAVGMERGPIPTRAIQEEADRLGLDVLEADTLEWVIRRVDDWVLTRQAKNQPSK